MNLKKGYDIIASKIDECIEKILVKLHYNINPSLNLKGYKSSIAIVVFDILIAFVSFKTLKSDISFWIFLFYVVRIFRHLFIYYRDDKALLKKLSDQFGSFQVDEKKSTYEILLYANAYFLFLITFIFLVCGLLDKTNNYTDVYFFVIEIFYVFIHSLNCLLNDVAKVYGAEASVR